MENVLLKLVEAHYYVDEDDRLVEKNVYEVMPEELSDVIERITVIQDDKKQSNKKKYGNPRNRH